MKKLLLVLLLCVGCSTVPSVPTAEVKGSPTPLSGPAPTALTIPAALFKGSPTPVPSPSSTATAMSTVTAYPTLSVTPSAPTAVPLIPVNTPQASQQPEFFESFDQDLGANPDPLRWNTFVNGTEAFLQKDGYVRLSGASNKDNEWSGLSLSPSSFFDRPLQDFGVVEARMRIPPGGQGGDILLNMNLERRSSEIGRIAMCNVSVTRDKQSFLGCGLQDGALHGHRYPILNDRWYTLRIEIDPVSLHVFFFVDGAFLASDPLSVEGWGDPNARFGLSFFAGQFSKGYGVIDLDEVVIKQRPEWSAVTAAPTSVPITARSPELPLVQITKSDFTINGQSFRFIGANSIQFPEYRFLDMKIEDSLRTAAESNLKVVRIMMRYSGPGTIDWDPFDRYLDLASRNGVYVIVTLADCDPGPFRNDPDGFARSHPLCLYTHRESIDSYRRFIEEVLARKNTVNGRIYRDDSTVLAWDIANEPDYAGLTDREIQDWIRQIAAVTRRADPNTPVTLGINTIGEDFRLYDVLNVPELDFMSFHLYHYWQGPYRPTSIPAYLDKLISRINKFRAFGKPVVLEEFGFSSETSVLLDIKSSPQGWEQYIDLYRQAFDTAYSKGVSGILFWGWSPPGVSNLPVFWATAEHSADDKAFVDFIKNYKIPPAVVP